ncbi:MAG: hypothetical protein ACI9R3_002893 [Verrucomicrobiales bacterium]|jgi:hypothetical protein
MDIKNCTKKPLSLPLPGGKKLFLGPGKTGQVTPKALEYKPLMTLIEAGDLETIGDGGKKSRGSNSDGPSPSPQYNP